MEVAAAAAVEVEVVEPANAQAEGHKAEKGHPWMLEGPLRTTNADQNLLRVLNLF